MPNNSADANKACLGLRDWVQRKPLYAECGGMLMLGTSLMDGEGQTHAMAGVLPFHAQRGRLQVGYRHLTATHETACC